MYVSGSMYLHDNIKRNLRKFIFKMECGLQ